VSPLLPRRAFLARGAAAVGGLVAALAARGATARPRRAAGLVVYRLSPGGEAADRPGATGCRSCRACRRHGANKLFASAAAADAHRAHPGCRCLVVADRLPAATWRL
jgi:hypothetical protein